MDEEITKRFGKKVELKSRAVPIYPKSAEREMQRLVNSYMAEVIKTVRDVRYDSNDDMRRLQKLAAAAEPRLKKIAGQVETHAFREWNRCAKETLGVELKEDHYIGGIYESDVTKWLLEVMQKLSELPGAAVEAVKKVIKKMAGKSLTEMKKAVSKKLASFKRQTKGRFVAMVAALFGTLNRKQQKDAGCGKYYWLSCRDSRVRPCHRALDGHIFEWDNPPEMWRETKHGRVYTGMRCNPGEDYGCRCIAIPVFSLFGLMLPTEKGENAHE